MMPSSHFLLLKIDEMTKNPDQHISAKVIRKSMYVQRMPRHHRNCCCELEKEQKISCSKMTAKRIKRNV